MGASKESDMLPASHKETTNVRDTWAKQFEFTLSVIGYTIGLGNIWRFPYLCMINGGGAFLVPYVFFMIVCGLPACFLELALGQFAGLSCVSVWKLCPLLKGTGWTCVIVDTIFSVYFNIIILWIIYYLGLSFAFDVPWKTCDNQWNTPSCIDFRGQNISSLKKANNTNSTTLQNTNWTLGNTNWTLGNNTNWTLGNITRLVEERTAAEEFWMYKVLNISNGIDEIGSVKWELLVCLIVAWLVVFLCLVKGIRSSGKVVYITATFPYLFLTILLIRGITLPGSLDGIKFYVIPDWSSLKEFKVWNAACLQVFYTLGIGFGCIMTMSSYSRFNNNCLRDSIIVCVTCCLTSIFAGFVIFSVVGFMAHQTGMPVEKVITQGPGLAFIAYPEAVAQLPISPLWAILFFLMLFTIGLDSQFAGIETISSCLKDEFPKLFHERKLLLHILVCVVLFLLGLPMITQAGIYIFQVLDWYVAVFGVMVAMFVECIAVCYIYGIGRFYRDISMMFNQRPSIIWAVCWGGIVPALMVIVLVFTMLHMTPPTYGDYKYPHWAEVMGWITAVISLVPIPVLALYFIVIKGQGSFIQRIRTGLRPTNDWGPAPEKYKEEYKFRNRHQTWRQRMSFTTTEPGLNGFMNGTPPENIVLTSKT